MFGREDDARRVLRVIRKRFGKYGLTLHPEKTRLVKFGRPHWRAVKPDPENGTFNFLGFTHYWGRSRKGYWVVKRRTAADRLRRSLRAVHEWCRKHRHWKVRRQHEELVAKIRGHYAYYGITSNGRSLSKFLHEVRRTWRYWLNRRSQRNRMPWKRFSEGVMKHYPLPGPKKVHSSMRPVANSLL